MGTEAALLFLAVQNITSAQWAHALLSKRCCCSASRKPTLVSYASKSFSGFDRVLLMCLWHVEIHVYVCCGLTWQLATRTMQPLTRSSPCRGMGRRMDNSKTHGLRSTQFNKTTKEILLPLLMIIVIMQNKLYTTQFFSPPDDQLCSHSLGSDFRIHEFPRAHKFCRFCQTHEFHRTCQTHRKNTELPEKFKLLEKGNFLPHSQPPFLNSA